MRHWSNLHPEEAGCSKRQAPDSEVEIHLALLLRESQEPTGGRGPGNEVKTQTHTTYQALGQTPDASVVAIASIMRERGYTFR